MRTKVKWFFTGGKALQDFECRWNSSTQRRSNHMIAGALALWEDDPDYARFTAMQAGAQATGAIAQPVTARETIYSNAELFESEVLTVTFGGSVEADSSGLAVEELCRECRRSRVVQTSNLTIRRTAQVRDCSYAFAVVGGQSKAVARILSRRAKEVLKSAEVPGIEFRPVLEFCTGAEREDLFQLIVSARTPPLDTHTRLIPDDSLPCETCGQPQLVAPDSRSDSRDGELFFPRFDAAQRPIALTEEAFGPQFLMTDCNKHLIMNGRIFQALVEAGIKGAGAEPAHLV